MALHSGTQHGAFDDLYAAPDLSRGLPRIRIPEHEHDPRLAYQIVHDELMLDGNSRMNLATFCQTWSEPEVHKLMDESVDKNLVDKDEYPETAKIETRCVQILADLWNAPDPETTIGCSTAGSSEAVMLCGLALHRRWRQRRREAGKSVDRPNLVCGSVQICWEKFARYFDIELRQVPMTLERTLLDPAAAIGACDENTIGVVPTLGVTMVLGYDPVKAISDALDALEERTGLSIPLHVDAASGGFIAPFIHPTVEWDFRLPRVKSINASGHKFGLTPLGCGWAIWRTPEDLPEELIFRVNYLGGEMPTFGLNFSRPGGQVIVQYYNFLRLGREGYRNVQQACADTGKFIAEHLKELDAFDVLYDGVGGIPGVIWTLKGNGSNPGFTLFDLADRLRYFGWQVPAYTLPKNVEGVVVQRVLARHGVSLELAASLVDDIRSAVSHLRRHPKTPSLTAQEASGFHH